MSKKDITDLIAEQRLKKEYNEVSERIQKTYILDPKIEIIKDIITGDKYTGMIVIKSYVDLVNDIGSVNAFFFDEFLATVCLDVFNMENKTGDYKKDIEKSCKTIKDSLVNSFKVNV